MAAATLTKSVIFLYVFILLKVVTGEPYEDRQALLNFLSNLHHTRPINWNLEYPVCTSWTGITCNRDHTAVIALRLPGVGFSGSIPSNTLSRLTSLQTLSLRSNTISGPFPSDLLKLGNLTSLHLQFNHLSGVLPSDFTVWKEGKKISIINLSNNRFNGSIPTNFKDLSRLTSLDLSRNSLSGDVGDLKVPSGLKYLNLSNNHLHGSVPISLRSRFPASAFSGNKISYETISSPPSKQPPPAVALPPLPSADQPHHKKHLSETSIVGMIIGGCTLLFITVVIYILLFCWKKESSTTKSVSKPSTKPSSNLPGSATANTRPITFFEGSTLAFDLEDLLSASAEVLGKGVYGTTYKAALEESTTVVVKRLKQVGNVGRKEFEQVMEGVGRMKQHENVVALRAYYYSKDEKLLVYDYYSHGSVSILLHGKTGENKQSAPLDWDTRLKIAIGAARGLAYIHSSSTNSKVTVHGNIKSSNILLSAGQFGCVSDLGLAAVITPPIPPLPARSAGYRAPELTTDPRRKVAATQASDVYSFGVFLLELLTGKSPLGEGINLVKWVNSVVREEWTAEVFDVELLRYTDVEEEMVQMLQLGMTCAVRMPELRPKMVDVVRVLEEVRRCGGSSRSGGSTPNELGYHGGGVENGSTSGVH